MLRKLQATIIYSFKMNRKQHQNHYQVLGIGRNANVNQIKKKFYQLAKVYHPDVSESKDAQAQFSRISLAYEVLSDEHKRKNYDSEQPNSQTGKSNADQKHGFQSRYRSTKRYTVNDEAQDYQPYASYDPYFKKNKKFWKPRRGTDININFSISFEESIRGAKKQVTYTQQQTCSHCQDKDHPLCFTCGGKGNIFNRTKRQKQACTNCSGRGYKNDCTNCGGHSFQEKQVKHSVYFEKNTHHKNILRLQGLGHHGYRAINGDLYITVIVEPSEIFRADGNNIYSQEQVDYIKAILGGKIQILTVYGKQQIEIEPGTQSGKQMRIFNKGLMSPFSKRRGDHIVKFRIKIPNNLSHKEKQLLEQLNN